MKFKHLSLLALATSSVMGADKYSSNQQWLETCRRNPGVEIPEYWTPDSPSTVSNNPVKNLLGTPVVLVFNSRTPVIDPASFAPLDAIRVSDALRRQSLEIYAAQFPTVRTNFVNFSAGMFAPNSSLVHLR